jgi:hypothetical protein
MNKNNQNDLTLNFPDSILAHLSASPVHLATIKNSIESNPAEFQNYFNGTMYLDDDMANEPFLCFVASLFKWCGCGVGIEGRMEGLYQIMKAIDDKAEEKISFQEFQDKIKNEFGGDNIFCLLMDSFDTLNLFEHGCSVYGSWLSQDGQVVYKHLQEWMKSRKI